MQLCAKSPLRCRFRFGHFLQQALDLLLVVALPQLEQVQNGPRNLLNLFHVDVQLGKPSFQLFLQYYTRYLEAANRNLKNDEKLINNCFQMLTEHAISYLVRRIEQTNVRPERIVDQTPCQR